MTDYQKIAARLDDARTAVDAVFAKLDSKSAKIDATLSKIEAGLDASHLSERLSKLEKETAVERR